MIGGTSKSRQKRFEPKQMSFVCYTTLRCWRQYINECVISIHVRQERMQTVSYIVPTF